MLIAIPDLVSAEQLAAIRATIDAAEWIDGNATSGAQSALATPGRFFGPRLA